MPPHANYALGNQVKAIFTNQQKKWPTVAIGATLFTPVMIAAHALRGSSVDTTPALSILRTQVPIHMVQTVVQTVPKQTGMNQGVARITFQTMCAEASQESCRTAIASGTGKTHEVSFQGTPAPLSCQSVAKTSARRLRLAHAEHVHVSVRDLSRRTFLSPTCVGLYCRVVHVFHACVACDVYSFCVSELDMIIHTFGGRLGWFLMAILGLIFVIGLAIVGICQCARAQRKKHAAHRALLQSGAGRPARPSFSTTHARVRGDTDSEYHSLSSPHANLRQPLLNAASSPGMASNGDLNRRAASSAADVVGGVPKAVNNNTIENHLVRIYFEGRNSFSDPLYLPVYPPPELALLIDHSAYQDFVTDLNSESQFTRCQKAM